MPDIITVDNDKLDFTLIVWTKDVSVKQEKLKAALTKRSQSAVLPACPREFREQVQHHLHIAQPPLLRAPKTQA